MSCSNRLLSTATAHFLSAVITDDFQNCGDHPRLLTDLAHARYHWR
nr:hypothetical protein [uncultured Prevotella sp.]